MGKSKKRNKDINPTEKAQDGLKRLLARGAKTSRIEEFLKRSRMSVSDVVRTKVRGRKDRYALHKLCKMGRLSLVTTVLGPQQRPDSSSLVRAAVLARDAEGNTPAHLAAIQAYKIAKGSDPRVDVSAAEKIMAYREIVLYLLERIPEASRIQNRKMETPREILDLASGNVRFGVNIEEEKEHKAFMERLHSETEDEYNFSWGKYENDFFEERESETYDAWVDRMARERREKTKPPDRPQKKKEEPRETPPPLPPLFEHHPPSLEEQHRKLCLEFRRVCEHLVAAASSKPPAEIGVAILGGLEVRADALKEALAHAVSTFGTEERKKFVKEQLKLWHPDKFDQKLSTLVPEESVRTAMAKFFKTVSGILIDLGRD